MNGSPLRKPAVSMRSVNAVICDTPRSCVVGAAAMAKGAAGGGSGGVEGEKGAMTVAPLLVLLLCEAEAGGGDVGDCGEHGDMRMGDSVVAEKADGERMLTWPIMAAPSLLPLPLLPACGGGGGWLYVWKGNGCRRGCCCW